MNTLKEYLTTHVGGTAIAVAVILFWKSFNFNELAFPLLLVVFFSMVVPDLDCVTHYHRSWLTHSLWLSVPFILFLPQYAIYVATGLITHLVVDLIKYPFTETSFRGTAQPFEPNLDKFQFVGFGIWLLGIAIPLWYLFPEITILL